MNDEFERRLKENRMSETRWNKLNTKWNTWSDEKIEEKLKEQAIVPVLVLGIPWLCFVNESLPVQIAFLIGAIYISKRNVDLLNYKSERHKRDWEEMFPVKTESEKKLEVARAIYGEKNGLPILPCKPNETVWIARVGYGTLKTKYKNEDEIMTDVNDGWAIAYTEKEAEELADKMRHYND